MKNQIIRDELLAILTKINNNQIGAWNGDLEGTIIAVALEDYFGEPESERPTTKYNDWYEDLGRLISKLNDSIFYAGCKVSFLDDKTDDFEIFIVEHVLPNGVKLMGIERIINDDELTIVH